MDTADFDSAVLKLTNAGVMSKAVAEHFLATHPSAINAVLRADALHLREVLFAHSGEENEEEKDDNG